MGERITCERGLGTCACHQKCNIGPIVLGATLGEIAVSGGPGRAARGLFSAAVLRSSLRIRRRGSRQASLLQFHGAAFDSNTVQSAKLRASGSANTTGANPAFHCTFAARSGAQLPITVNASAAEFGTKVHHQLFVNAMMPNTVGPANGVLPASGRCDPNSMRAVLPHSFWNPAPGYDPGGKLSMAEQGKVPNLDLDSVVTRPSTTHYAVGFTVQILSRRCGPCDDDRDHHHIGGQAMRS